MSVPQDEWSTARLADRLPFFDVYVRMKVDSNVMQYGTADVVIDDYTIPNGVEKTAFVRWRLPCYCSHTIFVSEPGIEKQTYKVDKKDDSKPIFLVYHLTKKRLFPIPQAAATIYEETEQEFLAQIEKQRIKHIGKTKVAQFKGEPTSRIIVQAAKDRVIYTGEFSVHQDGFELNYGFSDIPLVVLARPGTHEFKFTMFNVSTGKITVDLAEGEQKFLLFNLYKKLPMPFVYSFITEDIDRFLPVTIEEDSEPEVSKNTNFHYCAWLGDINEWKKIVYDPAWSDQLLVKNARGQSCFHFAVVHSHFDMAADCLHRGIDVDVRDNQGNTALMLAIVAGNFEAVHWARCHGASLVCKNFIGDHPILIAHYFERIEIFKYLIALGCGTSSAAVLRYLQELGWQQFDTRSFYIDNMSQHSACVGERAWYHKVWEDKQQILQTLESDSSRDPQGHETSIKKLQTYMKFCLHQLAIGGNPIAQYKLGRQAQEQGNTEEAEFYLSLATWNVLGHKKAGIALAHLLATRKKYSESIRVLLQTFNMEMDVPLFECRKKIFNKKNLDNEIREAFIQYLPYVEDTDDVCSFVNNEDIIKILRTGEHSISELLQRNEFYVVHKLVDKLETEAHSFRISVDILDNVISLCTCNGQLFHRVAKMIPRSSFDYYIDDVLGSGGFSTVYRGTMDSQTIAVKKINPFGHPSVSPFDYRCFQRECCLLRLLHHPNIMSYHGVAHEKYDHSNEAYFILTPVATRDIASLLKQNHPLDFKLVVWIAKSIARGMKHLHKFQIVHRDLKPENVFLFGDNEKEPTVCIADLGIAVNTSKATVKVTKSCGTTGYMSPEMLENQHSLTTPILMKSDLFSFGFVLYELITGRAPYEGDSIGGVAMKMNNARTKNIPPLELPPCNGNFRRIVNSCWAWDPEKRPDFATVHKKLKVLYSSL